MRGVGVTAPPNSTSRFMIEECATVAQPGWLALRRSLWPYGSEREHLAEMARFLEQPARYGQFVSYTDFGVPAGLAEASVRTDHVNGTDSSPVAFLEGLYVVPAYRRSGIARALVAAVANWSVERGCSEFASDAALDNEVSRAVHRSLGFVETERVVFFRKALRRDA